MVAAGGGSTSKLAIFGLRVAAYTKRRNISARVILIGALLLFLLAQGRLASRDFPEKKQEKYLLDYEPNENHDIL